ncbi:hypothetical protein CVT25_010688 [Psilocybe cyanescens]|uniref:UvrD-like helicase ATP-binding domain-containing protein n=1 Tax=Psilocybe cyanescens TaxID=93625 RepID=A0A409WK06_PSICY|nr:hypothetical protein CVT25_010688 [Psilocybe cyanescens]
MSTFHKFTYRAGLFDPANLITAQKIDEALYEFIAVVNETNYSQVLEDLLDKSHIVELIISGISDEIPLQEWILEGFPSSTQSFETTFTWKLLSKLSEFFLFHSSVDPVLRKHHQTVKLAPEILQALFAMTVLGNARPAGSDNSKVSKKSKTKSSQKEMKQANRSARRSVSNETPFIFTNIPIPQTSSDAISSISIFLENLKEILKFYLIEMRTEHFCTIIKESFIPQERPMELYINTAAIEIVDESPPAAPTTATTTAIAFPMIQPMKSALYFDSPEGFGKWSILVSSSADRDLRQHRRKAKASFDIIVKKIKELSNGHFSFDNQKRLNGPGTEVPIYEAKLSGDLRLVSIVFQATTLRPKPKFSEYMEYTPMRTWIAVYGTLSLLIVASGEGNIGAGDIWLSLNPLSLPLSSLADVCNNGQPQELLDSIEDNRDVTFPFEVSKYERKIIEHPLSCYVLGRSGTGKTTTMLHKMYRVEKQYQMNTKVEDLFASYLESLATSSNSDTKHRTAGRDSAETDEDDSIEWKNDLPQRFSELEDKDFPLFLTVDRLYALIEADIKFSERDTQSHPNSFEIRLPTGQPSIAANGKLVTYDRFLGEYWPHLTQSLKKNFNPSLVFSEIMGVIQGSEGTVTSPNGCLDRRAYEELSARTQPTFAEHRSAIYGLFESYRRLKSERRDYDTPDRTHDILRAITKRRGILGQTFDFVYIDETQDNLLVDSLVLRLLCRNTNGLFWAGDTAQTISAGSSFRFDDLTAFLFQFEEQRRLQDALPRSEKLKKSNKTKKFHLTVNYRSHSGIVNCAHSVIELISKYWPYSIDILPRERGNTDGVKPIFYQDLYPGFINEGHFLSKSRDSVEKIELGADQCILVRDDAAKQRLEDEIGKIGIIITLYDSKGLEFNDVFLYNFFHDSGVDVSQWRVVLNSISMDDLLHPTFQAAPRFDPTRHAAICSELKFLYVAITRARNNLRIADESLKGEPMRVLWTNRDQIRNCHPSDDLSDFAVPSSKDEWAKRALELSHNQKHALARDSYEKAEKPQEAALENARYLQQLAVRTPFDLRNGKREAAFKTAAEAFLSCAENATKLYTKRSYYRSSAECFEQAGDNLSAARVYQSAEDFTKASRLFRKIGRFDDVHSIIVSHGGEIEDVESIRDVVRLYYINKKEFNKAHQLFETIDEEIEYLEDRNLDMAQVDLLLMHGRKAKAANLHLTEGRILEAVDLFIEDGRVDATSLQRAVGCILQGLWQNLSVGTTVTASPEVRDYLNRFDMLEKSTIEPLHLLEFDMFQAIVSRELDKLAQLANSFLNTENTDAAFLCLDYYYAQIPSLEAMDIVEMTASLELFSKYIHILHDLAFHVDPSADPGVLKLFGITKANDDFVIPLNNVLSHSTSFSTILRTGPLSHQLSKDHLVAVFQRRLQERLLDRVTRENDICRRSPALYPCLRYVSYGECNRLIGPCNQAHISPDAIWHQNWLKAHLLQISIYDSILSIQFSAQMQSDRKFWIRKLHEVLNPPHHSLGSPHHVHCDVIDVLKARTVVIDWTRAISFNLQYWPWPNLSFLTIVLQAADLAFTLDKKEASVYMYRSSFVNSLDTPAIFFTENSQHILHALLISRNDKDSSSLLMGISLIRHVMDAAIPVDINVFMSFIEKICTSLIIFNQYQRTNDLHSITLPRGWIASALKRFDPAEAAQQDTKCFWLLLQPLRAILEGLYYHTEHLLFGNEMRRASSQSSAIRSIYISRVCRVLGLLGTNIRVEAFRRDIHICLTSLRRGANFRALPRLYSSYVNAADFVGILRATRRSMQGSAFDEMVQLFSERVQYRMHEIYGIRRIVYTKLEDILRLLDAYSNNVSDVCVSNTDSFNSLDVPYVNAEPPISEGDGEMLPGEDDVSDGNALDDTDDADVDPDFIPVIEIPKDVQVGHSHGEITASLVIQKILPNVLAKRRLFKSSGLKGAIYRWYIHCLRAASPGVMSHHELCSYKIQYLGFVPVLLGCLDGTRSLIMAKKAEMKGRFRAGTIRHEEMDEVSWNLTRISFLLKAIKKHQNVLGPCSELHTRHEVDELKKHVQSCLNLLFDLQLPMHLPNDIEEELHRIYKGMLQEVRAPTATKKKEKRPALNTDDCTESLSACDWEDESDEWQLENGISPV